MRLELDTNRVFTSIATAQAALDEWVSHYNTQRPHQSLADATPASRFFADGGQGASSRQAVRTSARAGEDWVARKVGGNGVVCVSWQQVSVGKHHAGDRCDVLVTDGLLQFWVGNELIKTVARTSTGEVRKKRASEFTPRA